MAIDEALLESVTSKNSSSILRLYSWIPYCLSLGLSQPVSDANETSLRKNGWDLVRRPTGGRAILHADELTYSITAPLDDPNVHGGVIESYRHFSTCLIKALNFLGVQADAKLKEAADRAVKNNPVCFQYPSDYEITVGGKKIIGSAQARKKNGLLQHGSLPIYGNIARIIDGLFFETENSRSIARSNLLERATTLAEISGHRFSWGEVTNAIISGFEEGLAVKFKPSELTNHEITRAEQLVQEKYGNPSWTRKI